MAKRRRQTTGMPRRGSAPAAKRDEGSREYESRAARESRVQRRVLIGTGVTIALVVLLLLGAVVSELFVTPNRVTATVAGEAISVSDFQDRVRLERAILNSRITNYVSLLSASGLDPNQFAGQEPLRGWLSLVNDSGQLGSSVIDDMVENILIRREAGARGLGVDKVAIDRQIDDFLGLETPGQDSGPEVEPSPTVVPAATRTPFVSPTPREVASPTWTPQAAEATATATVTATATAVTETTPTFTPVPPTATLTVEEQRSRQDELRETILGDLAGSARISAERLNDFFRGLALREALAVALDEGNDTLLYVNARHILVGAETEADDLLSALADGDSFAALAAANSLDTSSGANGGELGWAPVTNYVRPFAEALANAAPGDTLGPVQSEFGWHVIQLRAREERSAAATLLETARDTAFRHWLEDRRAELEADIEISEVWAENVPDDPVFLLTGQE